MIKFMRKQSLKLSAAVVVGVTAGAENAFAEGGANFSDIAQNINTSIASIPGLLSGVSYMLGTLLGVLGVLKIKDHVENPSQTPLQHGAIRLCAGGGLFALPIIFDAMSETIGADGDATVQEELDAVDFAVTGAE